MNQFLESQLQELACKKQLKSLYVVQQYHFSFKLRAFFWRVRKIAKSGCKLRHVRPSVCLSVHPSARNSAPTGRILMKFDI